MNIVSQQCPNGAYPERPHKFDSMYIGENVAAHIFCEQCGEIRNADPSPVDSRPGDERIDANVGVLPPPHD